MNNRFFLPRLGFLRRDRNDEEGEEERADLDDEMGNHAEASRHPADEASAATTAMPQITFDRSLPSAHEYLGEDLEEMSGRTILEDEGLLSLPLLPLPGVVLMPGQTLPLHLFDPHDFAMMRRAVDQDKTFGQILLRYGEEGRVQLASVGTTAEVLAFKDDTDQRSGISAAKVKAIGRQRFKVVETQRQMDGILMAKVRILSERVLAPPLEGAIPGSHRRLCVGAPDVVADLRQDGASDVDTQMKRDRKRRRIERLCGSQFTQWPSWVYRQYDPAYLMRKICEELKGWNRSFDADTVMSSRDATEFSFWVGGLLPLDDATKLRLLQTDSAIQRLRTELKLMQTCTMFCCHDCGRAIAQKRDIFSMSAAGPLGTYVNPHGHVHETLTTHRAEGLTLRGRPSTESSWFPGYAWRIAECRDCHAHMGWHFTLASAHRLEPAKFWGLCRSSLSLKFNADLEAAAAAGRVPEEPSGTPGGESHSEVLLV